MEGNFSYLELMASVVPPDPSSSARQKMDTSWNLHVRCFASPEFFYAADQMKKKSGTAGSSIFTLCDKASKTKKIDETSTPNQTAAASSICISPVQLESNLQLALMQASDVECEPESRVATPTPVIEDDVPMQADLEALEHDRGKRIRISMYAVNDQDRVRRRYIEMGPCQPKNHKFQLTTKSGSEHCFCRACFKEFPWIEYSVEKDAAFCFVCYLFKEKTKSPGGDASLYQSKGFNSWSRHCSLPGTGEGPYEHVNTQLSLGMNPTHHSIVDTHGTNRILPKVTLPPTTTVKEVAKKPKFSCPICIDEIVGAASTVCGHVFCQKCIRTSIQTQRKCPTCRTKLNLRNFRRVYLLTTGLNRSNHSWRGGASTPTLFLAAIVAMLYFYLNYSA